MENWEEYQQQADEVLDVSANLTDEQKLKAELFDNKILSLGYSYLHMAAELGLSPADTARGYLVKEAAALDSSIVIWQEKARYDGVRPFSAIPYIYGEAMVLSWGGPGEGTNSIPARDWLAYLPEADHPEYPSGSTCGCHAIAQAMRRFSGTDELNWSVEYPAGTSRIEPGITPASDTSLTFETWTNFASDCGQARIWGGVHFFAAVEASAALCSVFGDMAFEYYSTLLNGTAVLREAAQELEIDPWLAALDPPAAQVVQVPEPTTPTPEVCEAVSDSVLVTSVNSGIRCQALDTSGLQMLSGLLDAVDISGAMDSGVQVCFRESGSLILWDDQADLPSLTELTSYSVSGMTCGWIDQPGTVLLVAAASPPEDAPLVSATSTRRVPLSSCQVIPTSNVNFRASPAGASLNEIIPFGTNLVASQKSSGWYNVNYNGRSGWVSGDFVRTQGSC